MPRGNLTKFTKGIKGKILESIEITNERECRAISLEFADRTDLTIALHVSLTGHMELFDTHTGDFKLIEKIGRIPDEQWVGDDE